LNKRKRKKQLDKLNLPEKLLLSLVKSDAEFLTVEELVARYKNTVSKKTLANWRHPDPEKRKGPEYIKLGGKVLYPVIEILKWESKRTTKAARETL
jgi:hypothetical protein